MNTMVTKTPKSVKPDAWIVTNNQNDKSKPSDRGRKSIKNGKVYLDDGKEFEIELYNPLTECVLCDIRLNGQSISKTGLVLKPGQRFYLDCFVDEKKKFIFNTYQVDNSTESIDAIENNGALEVFFYKESVINIKNWNTRFKEVIIERYYPSYYPVYYPYHCDWIYYPRIYYGTGTSTGNLTSTCTSLGNITSSGTTYTTNGISGINSTTNGGGSGGIGGSTDYTTSTYTVNSSLRGDQTNCYYSNTGTIFNSENNSLIETGRIEKGNKSNQKFSEIDMDFDSNYISSTIIQLLPTSRKPKETKDIVNKKTLEINLKGSDETIDLIKKLADLHSAGILTDEEFSSKKSELLSKI